MLRDMHHRAVNERIQAAAEWPADSAKCLSHLLRRLLRDALLALVAAELSIE